MEPGELPPNEERDSDTGRTPWWQSEGDGVTRLEAQGKLPTCKERGGGHSAGDGASHEEGCADGGEDADGGGAGRACSVSESCVMHLLSYMMLQN